MICKRICREGKWQRGFSSCNIGVVLAVRVGHCPKLAVRYAVSRNTAVGRELLESGIINNLEVIALVCKINLMQKNLTRLIHP